MVVGSRLHGWISFAANLVGECRSRCCSLIEFPMRACLRVVPLAISAARHVRRLAGMARLSHLLPRGRRPRSYGDGADDLRVDQQRFVDG